MVISKILSNSSLKPSKLKRHLNTHHTKSAMKSKEYFERKRHDLQAQQEALTLFTTQSQSTLKASFLVAGQVARSKKAFAIVELILLSVIDICREIIGKNTASKLELVPLSNNTITRQIVEMSNDIKCQLSKRMKSSPYYLIQLDESTDLTNLAYCLYL